MARMFGNSPTPPRARRSRHWRPFQGTRSSPHAPRQLKGVLGDLNADFRGHGQQDSLALLKTLLAGLQNELRKYPALKEFRLETSRALRTELEIEQAGERAWWQFQLACESPIARHLTTMTQLLLTCEACQTHQVTYKAQFVLNVSPEPPLVTVAVEFTPFLGVRRYTFQVQVPPDAPSSQLVGTLERHLDLHCREFDGRRHGLVAATQDLRVLFCPQAGKRNVLSDGLSVRDLLHAHLPGGAPLHVYSVTQDALMPHGDEPQGKRPARVAVFAVHKHEGIRLGALPVVLRAEAAHPPDLHYYVVESLLHGILMDEEEGPSGLDARVLDWKDPEVFQLSWMEWDGMCRDARHPVAVRGDPAPVATVYWRLRRGERSHNANVRRLTAFVHDKICRTSAKLASLRQAAVSADAGRGDVSVRSLLEWYHAPRVVDGWCAACLKTQRMESRSSIWRASPLLLISIEKQDLNSEFSGDAHRFDRHGIGAAPRPLHLCADGLRVAMPGVGCRQKLGAAEDYRLFAVSHHIGSRSAGHYTAIVQSLANKRWYEVNDSSLRETRCPTVSANARIVFYRRGQ